jgi:hypothetical protein
MSIEAVAWALKTTLVRESVEKLVLIGIANHADHDGTGARPGQSVLARYACCSVRTVQRKLAELERRGLIRRGNQARADHIPHYARPIVWDLPIEEPDEALRQAGQNVRADTRDTPRQPDASDTAVSPTSRHEPDVTPTSRMAYKPSVKPSDEPSGLNTSSSEQFDLFWNAYPRHEHKREAVKAWERAVKRTDPGIIIAAARRYAEDPNRVQAFTAHPATWLNADAWEDDPLPPRHEVRDRQGEILSRELVTARAADARYQELLDQDMLALEDGGR